MSAPVARPHDREGKSRGKSVGYELQPGMLATGQGPEGGEVSRRSHDLLCDQDREAFLRKMMVVGQNLVEPELAHGLH